MYTMCEISMCIRCVRYQCVYDVCLTGAEFAGTAVVRLAPLFEEEGSVAIFSDIRIKTGTELTATPLQVTV